jgi:hypothetical protein
MVEDALTGRTFSWSAENPVQLDPAVGDSASILVVRGR